MSDEPTGYDPNPPRDTQSYVAEAKSYYDAIIEEFDGLRPNWGMTSATLKRAQEYIGWLEAYVEELENYIDSFGEYGGVVLD